MGETAVADAVVAVAGAGAVVTTGVVTAGVAIGALVSTGGKLTRTVITSLISCPTSKSEISAVNICPFFVNPGMCITSTFAGSMSVTTESSISRTLLLITVKV